MYAIRDSEGRFVGHARSKVGAHRVTRRANHAGSRVGVDWTLSPSDLRPGLQIASIGNPEWGVWTVDRKYDQRIWEIHSNDRGRGHSTTLFEGELRFWRRIGAQDERIIRARSRKNRALNRAGHAEEFVVRVGPPTDYWKVKPVELVIYLHVDDPSATETLRQALIKRLSPEPRSYVDGSVRVNRVNGELFDNFVIDQNANQITLHRYQAPAQPSRRWAANAPGDNLNSSVNMAGARVHRPDVRAVERAFGLQEGETYDYEDEATSSEARRISGHPVHFTTNENTGYITAWVKGAGNIASGYSMKEVEEKASRRLREPGVSEEIRAWLRNPRNQPRPMSPEVQARLKSGQDRDFEFLRGTKNRAGDDGVTYAEAKRVHDAAADESKAASAILQAFPKQANGLTPEVVKSSPEFRVAKARYDAASARERSVNEWFYKVFKKEIRVERASRGR